MNDSWKYMPLSDAVDICDSLRKPINSKERSSRIEGKSVDELYPYYGATGQVGYIDDYITDGEYVLLGEDGAPFLDAFAQKAYVISGKTWVNNHAHVLKARGDSKFLCYYLNSINYKGYVSGTTRLKLTQGQMKQIPIPCPALSEQQRIVSRIEDLFSSLDNAVETLQKTKEQLTVYRQAVLKEAFKVEDTWDEYNLGSLMAIVRNGYGLKPTDNGEYRILTIGSVRSCSLDLNNFRLNQEPFVEDDQIAENDLLFTRYNGNADFVGCCARVPAITVPYAYPDKLIKFRPKLNNVIHAKFLQYYVSHGNARKYLRSKIKTTSGQNGIAGSDIKKLIVHLPSLEFQSLIVTMIEEKFSACDSIEQTVNTTLAQAEAMRQSILKEAFEGRL